MSFQTYAPTLLPRLHRSRLVVPASEIRFFAKAAASEADAICLDLEDGVAPADKERARANAVAALSDIDWAGKMLSCRINGLDTHWCYRDVIALAEAGDRLDALMIPKVGNPSDVYAIDMLATQAGQATGRTRPIALEAQIETAAGLANVEAIAAASPRLSSLHFGHADLSVSLGMRTMRIAGDSDDYVAIASPGGAGERLRHINDPWHYGLMRTIAAARAHGLLPFEGPYGEFRDREGLEIYARRAAFLGCAGKWAIHPDQIGPINAAFRPTDAEIAEARKILRALAAAEAGGRGAISVDGVLIDMITIRQARQVLTLAGMSD